MKRTHIGELEGHKGKEVLVKGWVWVKRDQGKIVFFDLRDATGTVQVVVHTGHPAALEQGKKLKSQWVVAVTGRVNERQERARTKAPNGSIELEALEIHVINESEELPFDVTADTKDIDENLRLQYRYLDLRSDRMQKNIRLRSEFVRRARDFLFSRKFVEIETPILTESTPEGSRDFVVPSRLNPGMFYALPQSPQQYKQLLMVAGFERYFQIARAIRDEDLRADRGFEHTQIDLEMSFVERDDVMALVEEMVTTVVESMGYTVKTKPFPVITYKDAMETYSADKFDMRTEEEKKEGVLAYAWVADFPFFEKTDGGGWTFSHNPFSMPKTEHIEWLLDAAKGKNVAKIGDILTTQYDLVCNGYESGGGSIRAHDPDILRAVYAIMGQSESETEKRVGHMLEAFTFGAPPHGGIALGVERNIMNLSGESALRDVQAFPMTRGGQTAVMKGPSELSKEQLDELSIEIKRKKKKS